MLYLSMELQIQVCLQAKSLVVNAEHFCIAKYKDFQNFVWPRL